MFFRPGNELPMHEAGDHHRGMGIDRGRELPERIVLADLLLRRWAPGDVDALHEAVTESFGELHRWLPWAVRPPRRADEQEYIAFSMRRWAAGEAFEYGIFDPAGQTLLGAVGLHDRVGPGAREIGYWVHSGHVRRGIATAGSAVLTMAAFGVPGTNRVEIHCDQANSASAAIPRRLGYRLDHIREVTRRDAPAECGRRMIWVMTRDAFAGSQADLRARAATA
jgi:RimJ/RimL family protein N-acetyltransferase